MTRPLPIAACLAYASFSFAAFAQTAPVLSETVQPETVQPETVQPASAQPAAVAPPAPTGNADNGRMLTYTCQGCHGIAGYKNAYPHYHVPKIGGQSTQYLTNALAEYKQGTRKHPTMQAQSQSFSDQDIADIAAFLSELTP